MSEGVSAIFRAITGTGGSARPAGATPPALQGDIVTAQEKAGHLAAAHQSLFFSALVGRNDHSDRACCDTIAAAVTDTPASVAGRRAHGATLHEAAAISFRASNALVRVNDVPRGGPTDPRHDHASFPRRQHHRDAGRGIAHQCRRGAWLPQHVGSPSLIGQHVADPGLTSSSDRKGKASKSGHDDMPLLPKPGSAGKDISALSGKPTDCEVASFRGTEPMATADLVMPEI
ncbi:hypothetical protein [Aureimonas sp. AU4]|uniref:hypothetical protein n=1 Tax=Aureimonas sp. AU4 TaxID=1638163 RepID=UPI000782F4BB|nr:hypothetical protein [Aureimonas sp. AU4]